MPNHVEYCALCDRDDPEVLTWDTTLNAYVCEHCLPSVAKQPVVADIGRCPRCGALHEWRDEQ